ncbi:16S rRNA (guanine(527)-N(7))-methyltransferase RsmG [Desulfitobacterium sp.]|uniref:16S rRNA (guanine(527)-N(7))-methyltransferase RsmG n=1 Tax=Desulfitobacterium sp. TaxID=49981 RepID=UPI002B1F79F5|nr:16S rRNA (guanine(527)-N(7))-methyltransferase RsmG [Desulfitobacterium sp.]MEA4900260.1 16S rRNA (guanine(527)-N(7))-methyltransferase RsmG [Desulfitobacterium sp.]
MIAEHLSAFRDLVSTIIEIKLSDTQLEQFSLYGDLLVEWNEKMNLTSITDPQEIIVKHFLDSLTLTPWVQGDKVVDIGTGAGFPGVPLKIFYNDKSFTLVDSLAKRLDFLQAVIMKLNLDCVTTIHTRAEDFGRNPQYRGQFDTVVSRAVARLPVLLEYALPVLNAGGVFLAAKGSQAEDEVKESANALEVLGAQVIDIKKFNLGEEAEHRSIIIIKKIKETPRQYPRKAGTPAKNPL